jgi:ribulose-phosphate 3-epimerase
MNIIIPTVLTSSRRTLEEELARVQGIARTVQIDIVDGRYAAPATWPYAEHGALTGLPEEGWLRSFGDFVYEVDLMVENPEETVGFWIAAGASRIVIHVEGARQLPKLVEELRRKYGHEKGFAPDLLSFGLAVHIDTDARVLAPYLIFIDFVQFMGIRAVGHQGQPFDASVVRKIRSFKKQYPHMPVQVDGGVSRETAPLLFEAGAHRLVVGHALWKAADVALEYALLEQFSEEYGQYR